MEPCPCRIIMNLVFTGCFHYNSRDEALRSIMTYDLKEEVEKQKNLSKKIDLSRKVGKIRLIAGSDCSYARDMRRIGAVIIVFKLPELSIVEAVNAIDDVRIPYIPGFLSLREGPVFEKAFCKLQNQPDVMLVDGNGIAHPRKMGLATHLGIRLAISAIGCAKNPMFPFRIPGEKRGCYTVYKNNLGEKVGYCLRTRKNIKPVFVSPGYRISFAQTKRIILSVSKYRIPEPIRKAHFLAKSLFLFE